MTPASALATTTACPMGGGLPVLAAAGVSSLIVYASALRLDLVNGVPSVRAWLAVLALLFVLYGTATIWLLRRPRSLQRAAVPIVFVFAVAFRLLWLPAGMTSPRAGDWASVPADVVADLRGDAVVFDRHLFYDDDVWRFLWEGHAVAHGINPYRIAPADARADVLLDAGARAAEPDAVWDEVRGRVNHAHLATIYPPGAQFLFAVAHALAPKSLLLFKGLLVALDLATIIVVGRLIEALGRPPGLVLVYAWNPLVVKAVAASAHIDGVIGLAVAAAALCLVRGRTTAAGWCLGAGVVVKLSPILLLPFLWRRTGWAGAVPVLAAIGLAFAPFVSATSGTSGLAAFAATWHFNALPWDAAAGFFEWTLRRGDLARPVVAAAAIAVVGVLHARDDRSGASFAGIAATALGVTLVLGPVVMPWYLLWLLPIAVAAAAWTWVLFSAAACLAFLVMIDGQERLWWLALEYGVLVVAGLRVLFLKVKENKTSCVMATV